MAPSLTLAPLLLLSTTFFRFVHPKVSMWIGEDEVAAFAGVLMEINIIEKDKLADYVRRGPEFTAGLPPIPPLADSISVTWTSGKGKGPKGKYSYKFLHIRAEDPEIMEGLKLSIPHSGLIPRRPTDFRVSLPCTGQKAGIANFKLIFEVKDETGKPLDGSPIRLKLAKYCRLQNDTCLVQKCANGGVCTPYGDCLCQKGYVGRRCEYSANCHDDCNRRGVCIRGDICKCRPGFRGKSCQRRAKKGGKGRGGRRKGGHGGKRVGKGGIKVGGTTVPARVTNEVEVHPGATPAPLYVPKRHRQGRKKKSKNGKKKERREDRLLEEKKEESPEKVELLQIADGNSKEAESTTEKGEMDEMAKKRDKKAERKEKRKNRRRKKQNITNVTSPSKM